MANPYYTNTKLDGDVMAQADLDGITQGFDNVDTEVTAVESRATALETITNGIDNTDLTHVKDVTPGTAQASRAVVLDASKDIATLGSVTLATLTDGTSTLTGGLLSGATLAANTAFTTPASTLVALGLTATAAEINLLDGSIAGTAVASKALVLDASKDVATVNNLTVTTITGAALADGVTAATQANGDSSTKVATTAYVDEYADGALLNNLFLIEDQKAAGTNGGTFTAGAWQTRDLNTSVSNGIAGASLASNQVTLPAGSYIVEALSKAYRVASHMTRLQNITDGSTEIWGISGYTISNPSDGFTVSDSSTLQGVVTIAAEKVFELQHRCSTTRVTNGYGSQVNSEFTVDHETYSQVSITKVA